MGLRRLQSSRLVRQNVLLFIGGFSAGVGGFVYNAIAGRVLGPEQYGEMASLFSLYTVGLSINLILMVVLARYSASLQADENLAGIRYLVRRTEVRLLIPTVFFVILCSAASFPIASFLHLRSPVPVVWLGIALGFCWYMAIPRGTLQGTQHFAALSLNQASELLIRVLALVLLLALGLGVNGAMLALVTGCAASLVIGTISLRRVLPREGQRVELPTMTSFIINACIGTIGITLLFNLDVVLAKHFLPAHAAGIYGGLNKIEVIIYYGTLSVSQVLFPRVIEAVARRDHPGRLLFLSAGLIVAAGLVALAFFALFPHLVVNILFGPAFHDADAFIVPVGLSGLCLSLCNLLVQFFMAVHDRWYIPLLAAGCLTQGLLITAFHDSLGQVVFSVLGTFVVLLLALTARVLLLLPRLRPEMVEDEEPAPISA
jgi:O-antigen/teichoic acid export membrane protein